MSVHYLLTMQSNIREQLRDTVKFQVDRSTHGDKLRDFHEWMVAIKKDTLHHVSTSICSQHNYNCSTFPAGMAEAKTLEWH